MHIDPIRGDMTSTSYAFRADDVGQPYGLVTRLKKQHPAFANIRGGDNCLVLSRGQAAAMIRAARNDGRYLDRHRFYDLWYHQP